jgi:branched-chain amino acid transport system substrate-binding protein
MLAFKNVKLPAAALLALAVISACSSSGGSSATNDSAAGGSAAPITLGFAIPVTSSILSFPQSKSAMEATTDAINAAGGIDGHQVKDLFCDTMYTANGEIDCMRTLTSAKVSAIIDPTIIQDQSGTAMELASRAGIPVIGTQGLAPTDFTSPDVFPIGSGNPGYAYGAAAALVEAGAKKIALFGSNEPATYFMFPLITDGLKSAALVPVQTIHVDPNADPTFASGAAQAIAGGVDGVVLLSSPTYVPKEVLALRQAGYTGKIATVASIMQPNIISALGANANGILISSQTRLVSDTSNSGVAAFLAIMKKYQPQAVLDENSETMYAAIELYASVMAHAKSFTSASVLAAFKALSTPVSLGIVGPYQVQPHKVYLSAYPQIYNPTVAIGTVKNGAIVTNGSGLINPFTVLSSNS